MRFITTARCPESLRRVHGGAVLAAKARTTQQLTGLLAAQLPSPNGLLVSTHSVPVACRISVKQLPLELVGGGVRRLTSPVVGPETVARLNVLRPDIAFLAPMETTRRSG